MMESISFFSTYVMFVIFFCPAKKCVMILREGEKQNIRGPFKVCEALAK